MAILVQKDLLMLGLRRDPFTFSHCMRVGELARSVAKATKMSGRSEQLFVEACRFHDIGKLLLPKELLSKKKPLEEHELAIIREHPALGVQLASEILSWREPRMLTIIRSHHERWDGTGYPDGLRGKQIPIWARICAVIDAYDAMVHTRPYNRVKSIEEAKDELREQSGKQFDAACVNLFLSISVVSNVPLSQYP